MSRIIILPWDGAAVVETEATAPDGRWLSLYAAPLPACAWGRWIWTVDTHLGGGDHDLRPVAMGIAYNKDEATAAAEEAARNLLRPRPRLKAVA
jgi:hypothetical protein